MKLDRIKRIFKGKAQASDYHIKIDMGEFEVSFLYFTSRIFFLQALSAIEKRVKKNIKALESFDVPEKLLGGVGKQARKDLEKVEKQVQKDKPCFKVLSSQVVSASLKREDNKYFMTVLVKGDCTE